MHFCCSSATALSAAFCFKLRRRLGQLPQQECVQLRVPLEQVRRGNPGLALRTTAALES